MYAQELEVLAENISKSCHPKCPIQTQYKNIQECKLKIDPFSIALQIGYSKI